ncbi:MAG: Rieske (2Fe-2S) protein [Anaerolineae bacterium]
MPWHRVLDALAEGERAVVQVGERDVLLINHAGEVFACDNLCPHMRLPLEIGEVRADCVIQCPWHRSSFDLRSGHVHTWSTWPPGIGAVLARITPQRDLPVFPVQIDEEGAVWVELADGQ